MNYGYRLGGLALLLVIMSNVSSKTVVIIPFPGFEHADLLFSNRERDDSTKPYRALRKALHALGHTVEVSKGISCSDDTVAIIALSMHSTAVVQALARQKHIKKLLFVFEPPTVNPIEYVPQIHQVYTMVYTMVDTIVGCQYRKFYYPQACLTMRESPIPFMQRKMSTLIAGDKSSSFPFELYTARRDTIRFFEKKHPGDFDLYGVGWSTERFSSYKGMIDSKIDCLHKYRFCICYENTYDLPGYITEKIFDCFVAGCIPVYWGASNIYTYIPAQCFIDRRSFESHEKLYQYMASFSHDEYQTYKNAIQDFLASTYAFLFSTQFFVHTVLDALDSAYPKEKVFSEYEIQQVNEAIALDAVLRKEIPVCMRKERMKRCIMQSLLSRMPYA